jgi:hypothetical protein
MRGEALALRLIVGLLLLALIVEALRVLTSRTALWLAAERDLVAAEAELRAAWRAAGDRGQPPGPRDVEKTPPDRSGGAVAGSDEAREG